MNRDKIYLDNNATTPVLPAVADAMTEAVLSSYANPSSAHSMGRASRALVEKARDSVASLVCADPECVVFTSGGTEANNQVLQSCLPPSDGPMRIVTTTTEHSSILRSCEYL